MNTPNSGQLAPAMDEPARFTVQLSRAALDVIREQVDVGGTELETGGIILGHARADRCDIVVAGDPGPNAVRKPRAFSRDLAHAEQLADAAWADQRADWVGEWHTHPMGLPTPSSVDLASYGRHLADPDLGFDYFIALIVALAPPALGRTSDTAPLAQVGGALMTAWVITDQAATSAALTLDEET